jgi:O-antigen biosynthesis protein
MRKIGIVFDSTLRPETTGAYCLRALERIADLRGQLAIQHLPPRMLDEVQPGEFDLFIAVDDGLEYRIPEICRPMAWWAIDTHVDFERCLRRGRQADWTFAAQRNGADELRAAGVETSRWLPLACDPDLHGRREADLAFDIAFVGHVFPGRRAELLQRIRSTYPASFVGQKFFEEMALIYSGSRIVFNCSLRDDINMRVFEGLCSGSLLVTNDLSANGLKELFHDGEHLVTYRDEAELFALLGHYLKHPVDRERIAAAGRAEVLARHTYSHRMQELLCVVDEQSMHRRSSSSKREPKSPPYYEFARQDVLELIPNSAKRVLDLGCGTGRLGEALGARQSAAVVGVEISPEAASAARGRLERVVLGDVESADVEFEPASFDCVVCADVLEHLRRPDLVLKKIRRWLAPHGSLVTSIPNVRNQSVIRSLLAGNWTYESSGLLDSDHVRFFTRREIEKLLFRCGFEIEEMAFVGGEGFGEWARQGSPRDVSIGGLSLRVGSSAEAAEFFAYQYLTRSRPADLPVPGLTSIVIVTHNEIAHTRACLDSIRLRTDEPYELIVVDNGSTDGTPQEVKLHTDIRLIANAGNRGFPAAVNQGIAIAAGSQILLLNNDTLVTTGWLRRMLSALESAPGVGLVGPVSNRVSGAQRVDARYGQISELDGFAWQWGLEHSRQTLATDRLVGFCLLIKRTVIEQIGGLDERFGIGNFEDDDFCRRAQQAGLKLLIARDAFVHHAGHATFVGSGADLNAILDRNRRLYEEKWSEPAAQGPAQDVPPKSGSLQSVADNSGRFPFRLSACMIVRDNERTIRAALESLRPWVDEIVVVDTGSHDRTPDICRELGARVIDWAWRDDFAAARNESLRHARGEWIFWMDSDDTIPHECGERLRRLADGQHAMNVMGYVMQVHCPGAGQGTTVVDHVKMVRNRPDLRFEFRIHEQILPSIRRAGGEVGRTGIYVVHSGADRSSAAVSRKIERDLRLLELEARERPDHPFVLFNFGMTHLEAGMLPDSVAALERCISVSHPGESHLRKAYSLLCCALMTDDRHAAAEGRCDEGLTLFPNDKELLFRKAMLLHQRGALADAASIYLRILEEPAEECFRSVDADLSGLKARHNLALVYEDANEFEQALGIWKELSEKNPGYEPAWAAWMQLLDRLGRESERQTLQASRQANILSGATSDNDCVRQAAA